MTTKPFDSTTSHARRLAPVLILALAFAAACDDPNLFGPGGSAPSITSLAIAPDTVSDGDTIRIAVAAEAARAIDRFRVVVTGGAVLDTTFGVPSAAREVEGDFEVYVPMGTGPDSLLYFRVEALDVNDLSSAEAGDPPTDTIFVYDATVPEVSASASPDTVGAGDPIQVELSASDARGLAQVGFTITSDVGWDTTIVQAITGYQQVYENTFTVLAPDIDITELRIEAFATDLNTLMATTSAQGDLVLTDLTGPQFVSIVTDPDSMIPLTRDLRVTVDLFDPAGIRKVTFQGLAYRGVASEGTDHIVERFITREITFPRPTDGPGLPESYTLDPLLETPDDTLAEPVKLIVVAEDSLGNVSRYEKDMYVGGPDVQLLFPPEDFATGFGIDFEARVFIDDSRGIDSAKLVLGGIANQTIPLALPARTDTPFLLVQSVTMPSAEGTVTLQARAWNTDEVGGLSKVSNISVLSTEPTDVTPPVVSVTATRLGEGSAEPRMELTDRIRIVVSAYDAHSGLARIGLTAVAARAGVEHSITDEVTFAGTKSLQQLVYEVAVDELYAQFGITGAATLDALLPEDIDLRIHGFAADVEGQVACSTGLDEQRSCSPAGYDPATFYEAADTAGLLLELTAVRGHTVLLANRAATIADLAVDEVDDRLFLSNISDNLVEMLDMDADPRNNQFLSPIQVGSRPWGLFIGERVVRASDEAFLSGLVTAGSVVPTLIVANSGGTNMSLVHLDTDPANIQEVDVVRLQTPNSVLYQVQAGEDDFGRTWRAEWIDFSDRPQFLAQDQLLRIVYSTVGTDAAPTTTLRFAHPDPNPTETTDEAEARFFLTSDMVEAGTGEMLALANVDSIQILENATTHDQIQVFVHEPGHPDRVLASGFFVELQDAVNAAIGQIDAVMTGWGVPQRAPLFYPVLFGGTWILEPASSGGNSSVGFSDTTFVSASGDRSRIVVGEGAAAPTGRVILWTANESAVFSDEKQITDLISNASERVLGVGLNQNGSLGVARGVDATYFFTPDLRLQGLVQNEKSGGAGAVFHPDHDDPVDGGHADTGGAGFAFTGTPVNSIEVVNTFHFNNVTELVIRDDVVGPLKSGPPLASDNAGNGATCPNITVTDAADCVVAKLYGITSAGGVVVLNVRGRDLQ